MNSLKLPAHLRAVTAFSVLLVSFNGIAFAPLALADDGGGDLNFGSSQKWSIVPAGSPDLKPTERKPAESSFIQPSGTNFTPLPSTTPKTDWIQPDKTRSTTTNGDTTPPAASKPIKLYGRIEELTYTAGAKIPLKLQAMTPIRDTSRDISPTKLAGNVGSNISKLSGMTSGKVDAQVTKLSGKANESLLSTKVDETQQGFPIDYRGNWTGQLRVNLVNIDPSYYDFDRAEAEKQARMITPGISGKCTVSFYQGSNNKVQVRPTQVVFTVMANLAEEAKDLNLANSPLGAMLGNVNLSSLSGMQVPVPVAMPLGVLSSNTGVTGNQLTSDLVKIDLKEIAKGVLEEQLVTHDTDRNSSGQVRDFYTESVMRFTLINNDNMSMQAASVSYDNQGKYLNKIILAGNLQRGGSTDATPQTYTLFGNQGQNGQSGGAAANPLDALFGGAAGGQGGAGLFGGGNGGNGGNGNGQGGGLLDQVQQMQKMLQELNNQ